MEPVHCSFILPLQSCFYLSSLASFFICSRLPSWLHQALPGVTAPQRIAVSFSGRLVALFAVDGRLHVLLAGDLSRQVAKFQTRVSSLTVGPGSHCWAAGWDPQTPLVPS